MQIFQVPAEDQWIELLERFRLTTSNDRYASLRAQLRNEVVSLAQTHHQYLERIASECGVSLPQVPSFPQWSEQVPVVMSGHQPLIYHAGLQFKEESLERFSSHSSCIPVHIIIDSDEGDAGQLYLPVWDAATNNIRKAMDSLCEHRALFAYQFLGDVSRIREVFKKLQISVNSCRGESAAKKVESVGGIYEKLAGQPIATANSIVRWALKGRKHLEVPFSEILHLPLVESLIRSWVGDPQRLVALYNTVLEEFRAERKIKNTANPFPNMTSSSEEFELPFWIINTIEKLRRPCTVRKGKDLLLAPGEYLAPRGSITTLLLRGFCADLFIHGKGGAKYDPFVERFAEAFLDLTLAPFVVASADERFFPREFAAIEAAEVLKEQYKKIISHTDTFMGTGLFPLAAEVELTPLLEKRSANVAALKAASDPSTRSIASHVLNDVNRSVKRILEESVFREKLTILSMPEATIEAWRSRDYPQFITQADEL